MSVQRYRVPVHGSEPLTPPLAQSGLIAIDKRLKRAGNGHGHMLSGTGTCGNKIMILYAVRLARLAMTMTMTRLVLLATGAAQELYQFALRVVLSRKKSEGSRLYRVHATSQCSCLTCLEIRLPCRYIIHTYIIHTYHHQPSYHTRLPTT